VTCPFYVCDGRPSCLLGEPDGRHCGPRQYPVCVCNLDEIGRGEAWRACADMLTAIYTGLEESGAMDDRIIVFSWGETATNYDLFRNIAWDELTAVGWSP